MVTKKKITKKKVSKKTVSPRKSPSAVDKLLIENFVHLQKVMTTLSTKFDHLTNQISDLLKVFEDSAESLAKREFDFEKVMPGAKLKQ